MSASRLDSSTMTSRSRFVHRGLEVEVWTCERQRGAVDRCEWSAQLVRDRRDEVHV